jgi:hypothetical protein
LSRYAGSSGSDRRRSSAALTPCSTPTSGCANTLLDADFGLVSAYFTAIGDTFLAAVFPDIGSLLP